MKTLIIGDIFGKPGRRMTKKVIKKLREEYEIDFIIANTENLAHGSGMTLATFNEMKEAGIDFFTTGNHIFKKKEIFPELEKESTKILRPENFPPANPGKGHQVIQINDQQILIVNLMGRVFMRHDYDCPLRTIDRVLEQYQKETFDAIFVDFHGEATSEKIAFKHYVDGRVTAVWGTHTHVPTADEEVTQKGTAYITDVGMVGPMDSVIGSKKEEIIESYLKQDKFRLDVAPDGPCVFNAILIESNDMKAEKIQRIQIKES